MTRPRIIGLVALLVLWALPIDAAATGNPLEAAWDHYRSGRLDDAAAGFEAAGRSRNTATRQNALLGLAYVRLRQGRAAAAEGLLSRLAAADYRPEEVLPRLVEARIALSRFDDALTAAQSLPESLRTAQKETIAEARLRADFAALPDTPQASAGFISAHRGDLARCRVPDLFFKAAGRAEPPDLAGDTYRSLLRDCPLPEPLYQAVLESLGWHYYNQGDVQEAEVVFIKLSAEFAGHRGAALGLGYCRLNTGRAATALAPLEEAGIPDDPEVLTLKRLVFTQLGWQHYDARQFDDARHMAEQALAIAPQDRDARLLLAWIDLRTDAPERALDTFEAIHRNEASLDTAEQLLAGQRAAGRLWAAQTTAETMAAAEDPAFRTRAADFFFDSGQPLRAAQTANRPDRCYWNADTSWVGLEGYVRHRDGDKGTSRLDEFALPMTVETVIGAGRRAFLNVTPKHLDSGRAPDPPPVGHFYRLIDGASPSRDLIEDASVWIPQIGMETEGPLNWSARVGTTPIGGEIDPTVTGVLSAGTDRWHIDLHRCSVTDSILSTTGLRDPYGDRSWGRVVRSGASIGGVVPLDRTYWLSGAIGGDFYDGEHTWDNFRVTLDLAAGGSWEVREGDELTAGLFFTAQHFDRNSNFFTFGHGGYYSPELMTMTGPFLRYRSTACRPYWFDIQTSLGWLHQETEDAPRYPLLDALPSGLSPAAAAEAGGTFAGETRDDLGYAVRGEAWRLVSKHLALSVFAGAQDASDHAEWMAGFGLRWYFKPQKGFWRRDDTFKRLGDCANR